MKIDVLTAFLAGETSLTASVVSSCGLAGLTTGLFGSTGVVTGLYVLDDANLVDEVVILLLRTFGSVGLMLGSFLCRGRRRGNSTRLEF